MSSIYEDQPCFFSSSLGYMLILEVVKVASLRFLWSLRWLHLDESKGVFGKCT